MGSSSAIFRVKIKSIWVATTQFLFPRNEKNSTIFPPSPTPSPPCCSSSWSWPPSADLVGLGRRAPKTWCGDPRNSPGVVIYPVPQNRWFVSWKSLFFNGWFFWGGKYHDFWKHPLSQAWWFKPWPFWDGENVKPSKGCWWRTQRSGMKKVTAWITWRKVFFPIYS